MKATEVYARLTTDPVREAVEKATQKMVEHWGMDGTDTQ